MEFITLCPGSVKAIQKKFLQTRFTMRKKHPDPRFSPQPDEIFGNGLEYLPGQKFQKRIILHIKMIRHDREPISELTSITAFQFIEKHSIQPAGFFKIKILQIVPIRIAGRGIEIKHISCVLMLDRKS